MRMRMRRTFLALAALAVAIAVVPFAAAKSGPPAKEDRGPSANAAEQAHISAAKGTSVQADAGLSANAAEQAQASAGSAASANAADGPSPRAVEKAQTTEIQILGLNDFHGNLEPPTGSGGRIGALTGPAPGVCVAPTCFLAGGVEYLATHVRQLRATNPNTLFVSAGDLIGATPLISALFHDEPTIEAFNLMDLDYNGVGNHEFDEGVDELLRMQNGGCHPVDGCLDGDGFAGAEFDFLAANVDLQGQRRDDLRAVQDPPLQRRQGRVRRHDAGGHAARSSRPAGISHVNFFDEADTVNALVPELKKQNVETIVVLLHEGGTTSNGRERRRRRAPDQRVRHRDGSAPRGRRRAWTTRSTSSSPATPTGRSTACSTARSSPARRTRAGS